MTNTDLMNKLGFDPATDVDAVNEYFLQALETVAADETLTLADFARGYESPRFRRHFDGRIEKQMMDYSCFALACIGSIIVNSQNMLELFALVRDTVNDTLIDGISDTYMGIANRHKGQDAQILDACSRHFPIHTIEGITAIGDAHDDKEDCWSFDFQIRHNPLTFAMEYAQEGDYDYLLDEVCGAYRAWKLIDADKFLKDLFESKEYKSIQKTPAAKAYPCAPILDRCVMAMARIFPRMYCGANRFFQLHSDPEAAVKAYMDARMARPSTMPAEGSWTQDIVKSRTNKPWPRTADERLPVDPRASTQDRKNIVAKGYKAKIEKDVTTSQNAAVEIQEKSPVVAFILCLLLGVVGAHKFYQGKTGMGFLYLLTCGLFGIGVLVDLFVLLFAMFKK